MKTGDKVTHRLTNERMVIVKSDDLVSVALRIDQPKEWHQLTLCRVEVYYFNYPIAICSNKNLIKCRLETKKITYGQQLSLI